MIKQLILNHFKLVKSLNILLYIIKYMNRLQFPQAKLLYAVAELYNQHRIDSN